MQDNWQEPSADGKSSVKEDQPYDNRAWGLVETLAKGALLEQCRSRRWGIFFKFLTFGWLFFTVAVFYKATNMSEVTGPASSVEHTALVDIDGQIGSNDVDADTVISGLRSAFEDENTKAVILRINSPGGSPVQSGYIYDEIRRLRGIYDDIPLFAVIMDIGASGGYYIASAADEIYADKASLVGSIGVISAGFGFVGTMEKLGVTRRVYHAGEDKAFLDPFQPIDKKSAAKWQIQLNTIHNQFIEVVKAGRGGRLKDSVDLFSGMVWSGEQAKELGLIDGLGSASYVAREVVGQEEIVDYTYRLSPLEKFARDFGAGVSATLVDIMGNGFQLM